MEDLEKLRSCGRLEIFSTARHHLGFFRNIACAATYSSPSSQVPLQDLLYHALHVVIARHPMLSAIAVNEDKQDSEVHFARLPSIDLRTCVEFVERNRLVKNGETDEELEQVLQHQHNLDFKQHLGTRPFWRLVILHPPQDISTFTAIWIFHHALGDGTCGPIFHRTLLSALQTASPTAPFPIVTPPSTPLLPPFEALHPHPISWPFFLRAILSSLFPSYFSPRAPKLWTGPPISAPNPLPTTRLKLLTLSPSTTNKLLSLSRSNKTTLTATLQTALATVLLSTLDASQYDKVLASGPISTRSLLQHDNKPVDEDAFVLAMGEYQYTHTRSSHPLTNFSWDSARAVRSAIQTERAKNGRDNPVSLLRYVSDMRKFFTDKIGQERTVSFEVSNIGVLKTEGVGEQHWKLGRCMFSQTPNVTGPPIVCSVVTGGDGCCVVVFSWLEGVVGEEMARGVVAGVEKQLDSLEG